jgi:hypothetical protein
MLHELSSRFWWNTHANWRSVPYTCGAQRHDLQLGDRFTVVFVRQVRCYDIVEKLYYSVGKYHIHYCSALAENSLTNTANCYPQSLECVAAGKELSFFSYSFDMIHSFILSQRFIDHTFHGSAGA